MRYAVLNLRKLVESNELTIAFWCSFHNAAKYLAIQICYVSL
jgi:hypothetical protein